MRHVPDQMADGRWDIIPSATMTMAVHQQATGSPMHASGDPNASEAMFNQHPAHLQVKCIEQWLTYY